MVTNLVPSASNLPISLTAALSRRLVRPINVFSHVFWGFEPHIIDANNRQVVIHVLGLSAVGRSADRTFRGRKFTANNSFLGFLHPLTSPQHNKMAENDTQHTVESIGATPSQSEDIWEDFPWTKFSGYTIFATAFNRH
jgi:hypothetical protein